MSSEVRLGFFSALGAYLVWGFLPVYFKALTHVSPDLLLAHRVIWSIPTGLLLVLLARNFSTFKTVFTRRRMMWLTVSSVLIGANWLIYIWAVANDRILEASLGYYINPLVNVAIGAMFLSERLSQRQWLAVAIATVGVLIMSFSMGRPPWIALFLCFSFAFYSLIRKQIQVDGRAGFIVEAAYLVPFAMLWMAYLAQSDTALWGNGTSWDVVLILMSGPLTAGPLILFAMAAKRLQLSTIGMMQYIGPTLQFCVALYFKETLGWGQALAFAFIWSALIIFTLDSMRMNRALFPKKNPAKQS